MAKELNILIVENDENDIQAYLDTIKTVNLENNGSIIINPVVRTTKEDGLNELRHDNWSAAFIDLKLSTGDILNAEEGNEIVREIYNKKRFPVFILTNTPKDVSKDFVESLFLRINSKDGIDYYTVFSEIIAIQNTGILNILGKKGAIESYLDEIFWKNISNFLSEWYKVNNSEKQLLRYILTHLQEYLDLSDDGSFDSYQTIEAYISPKIKKYIFTGDIVESNEEKGKFYVILTPACDLAPHGVECKPKTDRVLISEIEDFSSNILADFIAKYKKDSDEKKMQNEVDKIKKLLRNNYADQYFYFPPSGIFKGGIVNFRKLQSIKYKDFLKNYNSNCNLSGPFLKDLIGRFSFYYSRQGAPDYNFDNLLAGHLK